MHRIQSYLLFIVFTFLCCLQQVNAQIWDWALSSEYKEYFSSGASFTNASGNTVFTGSYKDSIKIGSYRLVNEGQQKLFIAVADANGNIIQAFSDGVITDPSAAYVYDVQMDVDGSIILGGIFYADIQFNGVPYSCNGGAELFVAKYTAEGDFLWVKTFGSAQIADDILYKIALDNEGNIYATGFFGTSPMDLGSVILNNTGIQNAFLSKYSSDGNLLWARTVAIAGNSLSIHSRATCMAMSSENIYWMGYFRGTLTIEGESISSVTDQDEDVFIISLTKAGDFNWIKKDGGNSSDDCIRTAHVLADTMLIVTGYYQGASSNFAGHVLTNNPSTQSYHTAYYMASYHIDGTPKWAQPIFLTVGDDIMQSYGNVLYSVLDSELNVWVTGDFSGQVLLNGQSVNSIENSSDVFLMKYNTHTGEEMQRITIGTKKLEYPAGLGIDRCDELYSYGFYRDSVYFDGHLLNNDGCTSAFLARYNSNTGCNVTGLKEESEQSLLLLVPNPAQHQVTMQCPAFDKGEGTVIVYNARGQQEQLYVVAGPVEKIVLPLAVKPGIYLIQLITEKKKYSARLLVE